jgi:hypothetical protein
MIEAVLAILGTSTPFDVELTSSMALVLATAPVEFIAMPCWARASIDPNINKAAIAM